ncbi:flagellin [Spartinivicinus poritis]|uniref:flagellin N-terminal helical domain-containing protein n=1 Tax=Spartinivicinus poritis TaxID=2994640 RepID=UPI00237CA9C6|nr:flagellin [Spartinivicinus sp. A2-2]
MVQVINTNIASLVAQRNLDRADRLQSTALERLSSGLRINGAKDDAAGFAIAIRFDSKIRSTSVAIQNANNGISLSQTAEGALGSITENLQRIRELALQSANTNNTEVDRGALNEEAKQLIAEIQSVAVNTDFNGKKLLDGSFSTTLFQTGPDIGETIPIDIVKATTDSLGSALTDGISSTRPATVTASLSGDLLLNGFSVGASSSVDDNLSSVSKDASAVAKAAAINKVTNQTNVSATVNANSVGYTGATATNATVNGGIKINGVSISVATNTALSADVNRAAVVTALNNVSGQTGVKAIDTGNTTTGITLEASDGRNIQYDDNASGLAAAVGVGQAGAATTYVGTFSLVSTNGKEFTVDFGRSEIGNNIFGLNVGTFSGGNSGAVSQRLVSSTLNVGDLVINGTAVGQSLASSDNASSSTNAGSAIAKAAAINSVSTQTGVTAQALSTIVYGGAITTGNTRNESIQINGVTINISFNAADSASTIVNNVITAVNNSQGTTGVTAETFGTSFRLVAQDGRNIILENESANIGEAGFGAATLFFNNAQAAPVLLLSAGKIALTTNTGSIANSGFRVGNFGNVLSGQLVKDIDLTTSTGANDAITAIDNALDQIALQQSRLGAFQNRFQSAIDNLSIFNETQTTALSRIRDADFAAETANLSKALVLQQAGISVLAQANARPQQVLELLQAAE